MQKEVEQFLGEYGETTTQIHHKSKWNRSGTCFTLRPCGIPLAKELFQTVTVRDRLLLEVLHDAPGVDDALQVEVLPLNTSLRGLRLRLTAMAETSSRQYIKALVTDSFWKENIEAELVILPTEVRNSLALEVEHIHLNLAELRVLIARKADISEIICLHNKIEAFADRLVQIKMSL